MLLYREMMVAYWRNSGTHKYAMRKNAECLARNLAVHIPIRRLWRYTFGVEGKAKLCVYLSIMQVRRIGIAVPNILNPLNPELNPICHLLALLEAHHILHVNHGTRRNWSVSPSAVFSPKKTCRYPCNNRRGGPYSLSGRGVSRENRK